MSPRNSPFRVNIEQLEVEQNVNDLFQLSV